MDNTLISAVPQSQNGEELEVGGIAQYLSELSNDGPLPQGIEPKIEIASFQPEDVSFIDNDWLIKVTKVQAWLCLDQPIGLDDSLSVTAISLMEQISPDPAENCVEVSEDVVMLTELGAQHLETYLSRAVAHREAFIEAIEDDRSITEASEEWRVLWEESRSLAKHPEAIKAEVMTMKIRNFSDLAKDGQIELNPSYQRDNVWSNSDSQVLIDSILRGIPLPSIILNQVEGEDTLQIVDGKQRLTAILRFIGQHPAAREFARSKKDGEAEFDQNPKKFIRKHHLKSREIAENYLPFRISRYPSGDPLHALSGKYYHEIKDMDISHGQTKVKVRHIFENLNSKYLIPVIVYENTRIQDIHHVFSIYNKQGKKLNAEELRNATYHHLALTKLLLVLGGDRPNPDDLAPYLPPDVKSNIGEVGQTLRDRGFGTLRFKRTKVLSWVCALLLQEPGRTVTGISTPSTASHIDALLKSISDKQGAHPLFKNTALVSLAKDIKTAVLLHAELEDAWSPRFRSKKGHASRWEELPLVASLLATVILVATGKSTLLAERLPAVREFTNANLGPTKTQNKTQWEYISRIVAGVLCTLDVDRETAASALKDRYGYSCLDVIYSLAGILEA